MTFRSDITASRTPLYLPGTMLVIVGLVTIYLHRMQFKEVKSAALDSLKMLAGACFVLIFTIPMVRIYINSGLNDLGIESMPLLMADWVAVSVGGVYPLFAASIGALGAFIAGSNTVSNLKIGRAHV